MGILMSPLHQDLASGRWHSLTLAEQLGNIGSEYGRAQRAMHQGDADRFQNATDRCLELFDLTLVDPRWRGPRLRELARVREAACEEFFSASPDSKSLERYFLAFAVSARRAS